tara:strand:+ start:17335 stop:19023 length:1689 start_codon:yes stop_codon:yes gene_type:complete
VGNSYLLTCDLDAQLNIISADQDFSGYFNSFDLEYIQVPLFDVFKLSDHDNPDSFIEDLAHHDRPVKGFITLKARPNTSFEISIFPKRDDTGAHCGFHCVLISESRILSLEENLYKSEQQFYSIFNNNPLPIYDFGLDGLLRGCNQRLLDLTGYSFQEIKGISYKEMVAPEFHALTEEHTYEALKGISQKYELEIITKDKQRRKVRVTKFSKNYGHEVVGVYGVLEDITEQKASEERWKLLVQQNPQPVQIFCEDKFVYINSAGAEFYGARSPEELIGKNLYDFVHSDYYEMLQARGDALKQGQHLPPAESILVTLNGEKRNIIAHSRPIIYKGKRAIQAVLNDITEYKKQQQIIQDSLAEKETLLKEIHHRVKNNLAVISGLLELQILRVEDATVTHVLRDSQHRIHSIAMVHQKLYQSESLHHIEMGEYLENLAQSINTTYSRDGVTIHYSLSNVMVTIEEAIPCSLIMNELIVNSYKHAFSDDQVGNIYISLTQHEDQITLTVSDDGCGMPDDFDLSKTQSLGTTLINVLCQQLSAESGYTKGPNGKGTLFELSFSLDS